LRSSPCESPPPHTENLALAFVRHGKSVASGQSVESRTPKFHIGPILPPDTMEGRLLWVRRLGMVSVVMTVLLMTLGAWVKANDAGLSCPDWPACYGKYLPPFPSAENQGTWGTNATGAPIPIHYTQAQVLYEWTHRAVVSLTFVPILAFALATARAQRFEAPLRILPALAVGLYLFQAVLGAITVVTGNPPWATTWHLLNATLLLVTLTVATSYAYLKPGAAALRPAVKPKPFHFTPSVHSASRGFTYPSDKSGRAAEDQPLGPFPGEPAEESHE